MEREFPEFAEFYDWYPRAVMRADLFRLLVVYRLGGFYLDTDFLLEAPLDPLVEHAAVFAVEQEPDPVFLMNGFRHGWVA